jgi:hypothetical protein
VRDGFAYMMKKLGAVMLMALLAACASPLSGEYAKGRTNGKTMVLTKEVWSWYKDYVTKISGVNKGVFVVAVNGGVAYSASYYYCPGPSCMTESFSGKAMSRCRSFGAEYECILFANSADIQVSYKVEGAE